MNRALSFSLALAAIAATPAFAADSAWVAPFTLQLGAFSANASTTVRLDSDRGGSGTSVSLESDLEVTKNKTLPDLEFLWRINPRHGIEGSYVRLNRSGTRSISGEIHWGDVTFPVNTAVDTTFDSDVWRVAYRYSPIDECGNELAFLLGAHSTTIKTSMSGPSGSLAQSASLDFPLPTIGVRGGWRFADNWRLTGFAQLLKVKIGDYDGGLYNGAAAVEWAFLPQAYAGLGYNYYKYTLTSTKERARGEFDFRFDGPTLYLAWAFR